MEGHLSSVGATEVGSTARNGTPANCVLSKSATTFVTATTRLASGVPVVSVTGELDLATSWVVEEALLGASDDAAGAVIVDLAGCSFIDLRGLRVLLAARERLKRSDRPLALVAGNPDLLRIFKIARVDGLFETYPSLAAATEGSERG